MIKSEQVFEDFKMTLISRFPLMRLLFALVLMAASATIPVNAQSGRLSVSERIAKLESQVQSQAGQSMVDILNRLDDLQTEVQSLRGLVEQQSFEIEGLKKRSRDQYVDLDSRLTRLEGNPAAMSAPNIPTMPQNPPPMASASATGVDNAPGQLSMEEPQPTGTPASSAAITGNEALPAETTSPDLTPSTALPINAPSPNSVNGEQAAYDAAFAALREGRYAESARSFSAFLTQYPNGDLADNATYWLGESYYVTQNYKIALDTFKSLLDKFPESTKAADALLKVGYCHYELREWNEAEAALNLVIQRYPETTVARLAQGRLRALRLEGRTL